MHIAEGLVLFDPSILTLPSKHARVTEYSIFNRVVQKKKKKGKNRIQMMDLIFFFNIQAGINFSE